MTGYQNRSGSDRPESQLENSKLLGASNRSIHDLRFTIYSFKEGVSQMKRIIVVALLTIAAASVAAGQCGRSAKMVHSNPAVAAIKQLETERNKALVASDAAA